MTGTVLDRILEHKREELDARRLARPLLELEARCRDAARPRGFVAALQRRVRDGNAAVIAEIKKASPSKGVIRPDFDPVAIAEHYAAAGAACLSVLTDEHFFQGHDRFLQQVRDAVDLPVLRKDFLLDPYQIVEARALGADCVLLIVAALGPAELHELYQQAVEAGMGVLIEVHDADELATALALKPALIGINNRDLRTFETRLETTYALSPSVPPATLVVTESGIHDRQQVEAMRAHGVQAFLVGEAFMKADDPGAALEQLFFG